MRGKTRRYAVILSALSLCLLVVIFAAVMIGPVFIHPVDVLKMAAHGLSGFPSPTWTDSQYTIVADIRVPRVVLSVLVGIGLAMAGAAMQGLFRNPMAEPYILGMSSGAAAGAALAIVLGIGRVFGFLSVPALAFVGAALAIFVVYNIARTDGRTPTETLLLAGIAVGFFLYAVVSFLKIIASHEDLREVILWLMGSFALATWTDVGISLIPFLVGIGLICFFARELNALQFGEEQALHLGMEVETVKRILLVGVALVTAVSVSVSGIIGFVGLVIPHMVRLMVGPDHRILLPASGLAGGVFLVLADTLARTLMRPAEIPIGIITAAIGAPYFIYLLRRRKKAVSWW